MLEIIWNWLLACFINLLFDMPVIIITWFLSKWHYEKKKSTGEQK